MNELVLSNESIRDDVLKLQFEISELEKQVEYLNNCIKVSMDELDIVYSEYIMIRNKLSRVSYLPPETVPPPDISDEDLDTVKSIYKSIVHKTHPDKDISGEYIDLFHDAKAAYKSYNLRVLKDIKDKLEGCISTDYVSIDYLVRLQQYSQQLRNTIFSTKKSVPYVIYKLMMANRLPDAKSKYVSMILTQITILEIKKAKEEI